MHGVHTQQERKMNLMSGTRTSLRYLNTNGRCPAIHVGEKEEHSVLSTPWGIKIKTKGDLSSLFFPGFPGGVFTPSSQEA